MNWIDIFSLYMAFNAIVFVIAILFLEVKYFFINRKFWKKNKEVDKWFDENPTPDSFPIDSFLKNDCPNCKDYLVTLGWSARPQLTKIGSGEIVATKYAEILCNSSFYPDWDSKQESLSDFAMRHLDYWPVCQKCRTKVKQDQI